MRKFIKTLKNCWKIEDLCQHFLITLLFTAIYRFGSFVVLPDINPASLGQPQKQTEGGLMSLPDMLSGGTLSNASIFALGIMPYISASIVMQLLAIAVPYFQKIQREGESSRKKISMYTRYLTVFTLLSRASSYLMDLKYQASQALTTGISWTVFMVPATIILTAGSMFILWLGGRITNKSVGNGISLIIMIGVIACLLQAFVQEAGSRLTAISGGGSIMLVVGLLTLFGVVCTAILLVQGARKAPAQYARRLVGNKQYGGAHQYILLKPFTANVMPIIFAQALMFIPLATVQYQSDNASPIVCPLADPHNLLYNVIYVILIIAFTYFYMAITLNPVQMAEDMKRNDGFTPKIGPGRNTAEYTDTIMSRLTFPGSLLIALIAIMPALAGLSNIQQGFSRFSGGTPLLILVGVVIDTLQQIESHLLMRHYGGLPSVGHTRNNHIPAY